MTSILERRLIALTSRTGEPVGSFGTDGVVDMIAPYHSAPTVYKNLLILGTNGSPGGVRAFDARSGSNPAPRMMSTASIRRRGSSSTTSTTGR